MKEKAVESWKVSGVGEMHQYNKSSAIVAEVGDLTFTALPVLIIMGETSWAAEILNVIGFSFDDVGFDKWFSLVRQHTHALGTWARERVALALPKKLFRWCQKFMAIAFQGLEKRKPFS